MEIVIEDIPKDDLFDFVNTTKKIISDVLEPFGVEIEETKFYPHSFDDDRVYIFSDYASTHRPISTDHALIRLEDETLFATFSIFKAFDVAGRFLLGDMSDTVKRAMIVCSKLNEIKEEIERELPKELFFSDGRYTLILKNVFLDIGKAIFTDANKNMDPVPKVSERLVSLNINIEYDIVDEEAWAPPAADQMGSGAGGRKYKHAKEKFERKRNIK